MFKIFQHRRLKSFPYKNEESKVRNEQLVKIPNHSSIQWYQRKFYRNLWKILNRQQVLNEANDQ